MKDEKPVTRRWEIQTVDWREVHRRMAVARAVIERGAMPSADEKRAILKARAQELAQESSEEKTAGESIEVLAFLLADESYGIETGFVREIYPLKELTPLPGTPPFVLGITNVRGEILSVIDIKEFFDLPGTELTDQSKLIIIHDESMEFGLIADQISGVRLISLDQIQPQFFTPNGIGAEYTMGVTREPTVILHAGKILSETKMVVGEEAGQ